MEYRELLAGNEDAVHVKVFLDDQDVTDNAFWARVPAEPGIVATGEVGMYMKDANGDFVKIETPEGGELATEHKTGQVYWVSTVA